MYTYRPSRLRRRSLMTYRFGSLLVFGCLVVCVHLAVGNQLLLEALDRVQKGAGWVTMVSGRGGLAGHSTKVLLDPSDGRAEYRAAAAPGVRTMCDRHQKFC